MLRCKICVVLLVSHIIGFGQPSLYPNLIHHMDCNSLFKGQYTIQQGDVNDFLRSSGYDLKLIQYKGYFENGITDDLSGIFVNSNDFKELFPQGKVDPEFVHFVNGFLDKLPKTELFKSENILVCTYKEKEKEIITYFHFVNDRIVAYAHPIKTDPKINDAAFILESEFELAKTENRSILWFGDDVSISVSSIAKKHQVPFFRRITNIDVPLPEKIRSVDKVFVPKDAIVCNGIPSTKIELMQGGLPTSKLHLWQEYKAEIGKLTTGFKKQISTAEELKQEITEGNSDILFVVAHLKGSELFINNQTVTLDQIKNWGKRTTPTSGNRVAILCICNSGNQHYTTGSLFWKKQVEPLANILLNNGYFNQVISPDHIILRPETSSFIQHLLHKKTVVELQTVFNGWPIYVFGKIYKIQKGI